MDTKTVQIDEVGKIHINHKHSKRKVVNKKPREPKTIIYQESRNLSKQFHRYYKRFKKVDRIIKASIVENHITQLLILCSDSYFNPYEGIYKDIHVELHRIIFLIRDLTDCEILFQKHHTVLGKIYRQIEEAVKHFYDPMKEKVENINSQTEVTLSSNLLSDKILDEPRSYVNNNVN